MLSLKKLAIRGTIWTVVGYGGSQVLRLGANIIVTRLLVPEMFGLMALINTFIIGLKQLSDMGVAPSIIRSPRWNDLTLINTAWTLQVIRGFGLFFVSCVITWPIAHFYGDLRLLWILPVISSTLIMDGFAATSPVILSRKLELGKLTRFSFGIQIIALSVMIVWAYLRQTIWALVGGVWVSKLVNMVWSHRLVPELPNRFTWDKGAFEELFSFGKWVFLSTVMTFFAEQTDRLLLGKLLSFKILGIYTIALTFSDIPRQILLQISGQVIFPAISQLADLPRESLRAKVLAKRWWLLVVMAILLTFLVSFGDLIILALYDRRYAQAAWMLPILALGFWPSVLANFNGYWILAISKPLYVAVGNTCKTIYMIICLPLGVFQMGVLGAIIVVAFNDLLVYGAITYGLCREELSTIQQDLQATGLFVVLLALVLTGRYIWGFGSPISGLF